MKTKIIAAAAAFAIALSTLSTFAAASSSNIDTNCANILANSGAYAPADVKRCR
jgi:hypothetical protein